ncbi:hypothetical protein HRD49_18180 [Corallococcus exiguus]|uniref:hypothetical protein n=1 Tax=Corallococcus exiguus TaxID=83462 RepID=UPI001560DB4F|nr:hypothetical protein [Corallococcus exiguus]NRD53271.1 hypothetical protein [Corallococcus exiguus]NRD63683.1 hypothetical protein [Corallococcus exiguus]
MERGGRDGDGPRVTPWLDRGAKYYAILGMQLAGSDTTGGVVAFSVDLENDLKPLIETALGN